MEFFYPIVKFFTAGGAYMLPILVLHAFLQSKTMGLSDGLETAAIRFLNAVAARQAARAQSRLELVQPAASAA